MQMTIDFPGGACVNARFGSFTVRTDQPAESGGNDSAPTPFALFLAALGTCAGYYVLGFCRERGIPTEGIRLVQHAERDPATHLVSRVILDIQLPPEFPSKYAAAAIRAAGQCAVKKHLERPPAIEVKATSAAGA